MKLSDISVRRPVFAAVLAMLIAVVGLVGYFGLSVREYPDVDPPVVSVQTQYIGASASDDNRLLAVRDWQDEDRRPER